MLRALVPSGEEDFPEAGYSVLYVKWMGGTLQGTAFSDGHAHVGAVGEWSTKMGSLEKRPLSLAYGERHTTVDGRTLTGAGAFGFSLAFTTAHELGHILGLNHEHRPSIMQGKGPAFAAEHVASIQAWVADSAHPNTAWLEQSHRARYRSVMERAQPPSDGEPEAPPR